MTERLQPTGVDRILAASRRVEAARKAVGDADAEHAARRLRLVQEVQLAEAELTRIAAGARDPSGAVPPPEATTWLPHWPSLTEEGVPIAWRLAFHLLRDPVLDYRAVGDVLWPGQPQQVTRNRLSAQLTHLKRHDVIESLGGAHFRVNRERLAELSPIPLDASSTPEASQP